MTALNWARAHQAGVAAPVVLSATNEAVLKIVPAAAAPAARGRRTPGRERAGLTEVPGRCGAIVPCARDARLPNVGSTNDATGRIQMSTEQPTTSHPSTQRSASPAPVTDAPDRRSAGFRNLALAYVVGVALVVLQSVAYHHYAPKDGSVGQDVPVYFVSGLIGALIAAIGLFRVARAASRPRPHAWAWCSPCSACVIFPVAYFTPITFIWGVTSYLLSREAQPGPLRTAARVLGVIALCLTPLVVVLRAVGVTYQLGG